MSQLGNAPFGDEVNLDVGRPKTAALLIGGTPFIVVLVVVLGVAIGARGEKLGMLVLAAVTMLIALMPLFLDQGRRPSQRHLFLSLFSIVFIIYYVSPVFFIYLKARGAIDAPAMAGTALRSTDILNGQVIVLVGVFGLFAGYAGPLGKLIAQLMPRPRVEWSPPAVLSAASGLILLGWIIRIAGTAGIVPGILNTGFFNLMSYYSYFGNILLTIEFIRSRSSAAAVLLLANLSIGMFYGFVSGRKLDMLAPAVVVVLASAIIRSRFRIRWILVGALVLVLIYPLTEILRQNLDSKQNTLELFLNPISTLQRIGHIAVGMGPSEFLLSGAEAAAQRTDGLGVTSVIVRDTPKIAPFLHGETLGLFFAAFVPRILWSNKPEMSIGRYINETYGSGLIDPDVYSSTAPTNIGDFYLNFGVWGVLFGMALLGAIVRTAHESLFRHKTVVAIFIQSIVVFFLILSFEANVAVVWANTVFLLVPVAAIHLFIRMSSGSASIPIESPVFDQMRR